VDVVIVVFDNVLIKMTGHEEFGKPKQMPNRVDQETIDEMKVFDK